MLLSQPKISYQAKEEENALVAFRQLPPPSYQCCKTPKINFVTTKTTLSDREGLVLLIVLVTSLG